MQRALAQEQLCHQRVCEKNLVVIDGKVRLIQNEYLTKMGNPKTHAEAGFKPVEEVSDSASQISSVSSLNCSDKTDERNFMKIRNSLERQIARRGGFSNTAS